MTLHALRGERPTQTGPESLSPREVDVLEALIEVGSQKLAALRVGISYQTLKNHVMSARHKLGTEDALQSCVLWDRYRRALPPTWPEVDRRQADRRHGRDRRAP